MASSWNCAFMSVRLYVCMFAYVRVCGRVCLCLWAGGRAVAWLVTRMPVLSWLAVPTSSPAKPPHHSLRARTHGTALLHAPTHAHAHTHTRTHTRIRTRTPLLLVPAAGPQHAPRSPGPCPQDWPVAHQRVPARRDGVRHHVVRGGQQLYLHLQRLPRPRGTRHWRARVARRPPPALARLHTPQHPVDGRLGG
jgi:hypothetical protein